MKTNPHISVVTPVYGCCASLEELHKRLCAALSSITNDFEIIMINDESPDDSWLIIQALSKRDARVKGINLSRNFGQHYAIAAGLDFAQGDWIVVMDCDLQDVPEEIPNLYQKAREGYDVVVGRRTKRQDGLFKKTLSRVFYKVFAYLSESKVDNRIGNFGIYSQKVIHSIRQFKEQNRSFGLFAIWVGFKRIEIDVAHSARVCGKSSYTFRKMMHLAMDSIIAHSTRLLLLAVNLGFAISMLSLIYGGWIILRYFLWSVPVIGWTSLMVSVYFSTGLIIGTIGIVGLYVGKIFEEVKGRPLYIIESTTFETLNND